MPGLLTAELLFKADWHTPLLLFPLTAAFLVSRVASL